MADDPVALSERFDDYTKALDAAPWGVVNSAGQTVAGNLQVVNSDRTATGRLIQVQKVTDAAEQMKALLRQDTINKAIGEDLRQSLTTALSTQQANITKDITLTSPVSGGLVLFDLKHPAEFLVPVETPLRNMFPRTQGVGTSFRYKQITGISNAQTTAGLTPLHPGISDGTQTNFAAPGSANSEFFNRGPKISYAGQDKQVAYFQFGLSDEVTWSAEFAGVGFQDVRSLSQTSVLYASMLAEERMTVYGRGLDTNGFSGSITSPTGVMGTPRAAGTGETGITADATVTVWLVATTGFGYAPPVQAGTGVAVTAGQVVDVTIPDTPGATGFLVFVSTAASPTTANAFYYGTVSGSFTLQGAMPTSGQAANNSAYATNTTAQTVGYDGIIPIVTGPDSGYVHNIDGAFDKNNPGIEFQNAFATMYAQNLANPDRVLLNGSDRKQLSDLLKTASSTGYRLVVETDGLSGHQLGNIITGVQNETTGKMLDLMVHPYMPQGIAPILSDNLPFPNSNVASCWEYRNVQDYMGINWPVLQFTYDTSSYWYGTFFCHAPAWQGAITGIAAK
ncbi:MAG: hypothetical protein QJR12_16840 [Mycobacterium sp.]|uniref:hypothetical protein n=1 Tax=Mycobacterium sp. TaxID=1785 RepID=UPI002616F77E|nr:hypothetical protein [Mycobacterium sp.]MDI3315874.1 hypothetical protein [Mycobacterium sp.]